MLKSILRESSISPDKLFYIKKGLSLSLPIVKYNGELWNYDEDGRWHNTSDKLLNGMLIKKVNNSEYCYDRKREGISFDKNELEFIKK